jgi:hypothetical protein
MRKHITNAFNFDGIVLRLRKPDLDGDGKVGGIENVTQRYSGQGVSQIIQPTELGESLKQLNEDILEPDTRMSGIDMKARLHPVEVSSILAMDALVALGVLPKTCLAFSRQKKRLSVSIKGLGRGEMVDIVAGKREQDKATMGFMDKIKSNLPGGK